LSLSDKTGLRFKRRHLLISVIACFIFFLIAGVVLIRKNIADPNIPLLFSEQGAEWIRFREPTIPTARRPQERVTIFRSFFKVEKISSKAVLNFRAMKCAAVWLDGRLLFKHDPLAHLDTWKQSYGINLAPALNPGLHELRIKVLNPNGHPALLAYCKALKLYTGEHWEVSNDGKNWIYALSVDNIPPLLLSGLFQRADQALLAQLHVFLPVFLVVAIFSLLWARVDRPYRLVRAILTAQGIRWILLLSWMVLAINNIGKVPLHIGMDYSEHLRYIQYLAENQRIPLPTEGWQMFEAPFFYILSACIYKVFLNFFSMETVVRILRIVPLLCGAAQVELCYRALRYVYPGREDLQALGVVVGGLLPMNIYMSQVVGTEPMSGFLSGIVVVLVFKLLRSPSLPSRKNFLFMGLCLGLAILTKISAILLIFPVVFFIAYTHFTGDGLTARPVVLLAQRISLVIGVAFLVCGWYYVRNWIELGHFFIGGWDTSRNIMWWQDPGYRTLKQFFSFGQALCFPIYAGVVGIWDSLYSTIWMDGFLSGICVYSHRPPWNYGFLLSSAWLSLFPSAAIFIGILGALKKPAQSLRQGTLFAVCCITVFVLAILYLFLTIPIYSIGKASYTMGLIPCYAVLCAGGFDILTRKPLLRAGLYGIIACWAVSAYFAYFVF